MKKVQDFSTGVMSHVRNYYNNSLWSSPADGKKEEGVPGLPLEEGVPAPGLPRNAIDPSDPPFNAEST